MKFNARRRRKRQPLSLTNTAQDGGGADGEEELEEGQEVAVPTTKFLQTGSAAASSSPANNNKKHRNIYSRADNDKEAFSRNYELNINSQAGPRRVNSFKKERRKSPEEGIELLPPSFVLAKEEEEQQDVIMLNDEGNEGVLNAAVAAVAGAAHHGEMVDKSRGDDNWLEDEDDEYYPSRDHFSDLQNLHMPFWDSYDSINQLYLEIGEQYIEIRSPANWVMFIYFAYTSCQPHNHSLVVCWLITNNGKFICGIFYDTLSYFYSAAAAVLFPAH